MIDGLVLRTFVYVVSPVVTPASFGGLTFVHLVCMDIDALIRCWTLSTHARWNGRRSRVQQYAY